jgi:hypothetical protein
MLCFDVSRAFFLYLLALLLRNTDIHSCHRHTAAETTGASVGHSQMGRAAFGAYLGELSCAARTSAAASRARLLLALGLRIAASMSTTPSSACIDPDIRTTTIKEVYWELTTTRRYVTAAMTSNFCLKTKDRVLKTPPKESMTMNIIEMPTTSRRR